MLFPFLHKKITIHISLSVWQAFAIAALTLLLFYTGWEVYWYQKVGLAAIKWHTWGVLSIIIFVLFVVLPFSLFATLRKNFAVGFIYLLLCLMIGETHPFSLVEMYNSFPNFARTFLLTDSHENVLPFNEYYWLNSSDLSHKYTTAVELIESKKPGQKLTPDDLQKVGEIMMKALLDNSKKPVKTDSIKLYLITNYMSNDSVQTDKQLLYATKVGK